MAAAKARLPPDVVGACAGIFIPVSTLMLGLRFHARRQQKATFATDDWLMIPAYILLIGMCVTMLVGLDKHLIGYPTPNFVPGKPSAAANLPSWPFELQQIPALGFLKISIVLFYRRVFNTGHTPAHNWSTRIMTVLVAGWAIAYFFAFLFICGVKPSSYWESLKAETQQCVQVAPLHLSLAISDTIFDALILLMAVPMIWGLHMPNTRKLAVTGIFGLGIITVAASITRLVIFVQVAKLRFDPFLDFELTITSVMYWSMLEAGLGFLAANLVIVYSLLVRWAAMLGFGSITSGLRSKSSPKYGSNAYGSNSNGSNALRSNTHRTPSHTRNFSRPSYPNSADQYQESFRPMNQTDVYGPTKHGHGGPAQYVQGGIPKYMEQDVEQAYDEDHHIHMKTAFEVRHHIRQQ